MANEESVRVLEAKIERQIEGFRNHLRRITDPQHRVETQTGRAIGHATEAIRLANKLRRLKEHTVNREEANAI
jgi:hypothetical protein